MSERAALTVRAGDWPHGLRCGECSRLLEHGERYSERLTHMIGDVPAVMIVCLTCAIPEPDDITCGQEDEEATS